MPIDAGTSIQYLHGVGQARAALLQKLGITEVGHLLWHFPRGYEFRGNVKQLADARPGEMAAFILTVANEPTNANLRRGMTLTKLRAFDGTGVCDITYFNQPYRKDSLEKGREYRFFGKLQRENGRYLLASPAAEAVTEDKVLPALVPVYPLTAGLTQTLLSKLIGSAMNELLTQPGRIADPLPEEIRVENQLCDLNFALWNIHRPPDFEALAIAKRRLIFEELYRFALGASQSAPETRLAPAMPDGNVTPLENKLPYTFTRAQERSIGEIAADLSGTHPMRRLVSGDVGSGKTAVAASAAYIAVRNGFRCALMAPTEILAAQHYGDLSPLFRSLGIGCALLTGSTRIKERRRILDGLRDGGGEELGLVIGTHALIGEDVQIDRLGLVICDEQHRFGVGQRDALLAKTPYETCHQLTLSATPIPRTLAMFLYGDLSMSVLDELPPGRQRVETFTVNESYRQRLNNFIRRQKAEGHQTYVICPAVEEKEIGEVTQEEIRLFDFGYDAEEILRPDTPPKAAVVWAQTLAEALPDLKIGCVHGKLKPSEKDAVMRAFSAGDLDVLVATTVIEVGVNVPNATLMIVENAERFGLSQLHQLRGRVGRGNAKSCCVLVSDTKSETARKRLDVMRTTYDGFRIAQYDLEARGPGDFLPSEHSAPGHGDLRQSGELRFRLAGLCENIELLEAAVEAARKTAAKKRGPEG